MSKAKKIVTTALAILGVSILGYLILVEVLHGVSNNYLMHGASGVPEWSAPSQISRLLDQHIATAIWAICGMIYLFRTKGRPETAHRQVGWVTLAFLTLSLMLGSVAIPQSQIPSAKVLGGYNLLSVTLAVIVVGVIVCVVVGVLVNPKKYPKLHAMSMRMATFLFVGPFTVRAIVRGVMKLSGLSDPNAIAWVTDMTLVVAVLLAVSLALFAPWFRFQWGVLKLRREASEWTHFLCIVWTGVIISLIPLYTWFASQLMTACPKVLLAMMY